MKKIRVPTLQISSFNDLLRLTQCLTFFRIQSFPENVREVTKSAEQMARSFDQPHTAVSVRIVHT